MRFTPLGDQAITITLGDSIDEPTRRRVHAATSRIERAALPGIVDLVPGFASVTLHYDPDYTVELGERHVGLRFFAPIHHTVITRDGLAFFLDQNAGPDPDRCYRAAPG